MVAPRASSERRSGWVRMGHACGTLHYPHSEEGVAVFSSATVASIMGGPLACQAMCATHYTMRRRSLRRPHSAHGDGVRGVRTPGRVEPLPPVAFVPAFAKINLTLDVLGK